MKKLRVLYLVNIPSPYRVDFFNELGSQCDLTVLFERSNSKERNKHWINQEQIKFKAFFLKGINIKKDSALCLNIYKFLNKNKFDIFIIGGYSTPTGMFAIELLKMRKIPFVLNIDGGFIKNDRKLKHLMKKRYISSANYWLSTGNEGTNYLKHYGANEKKIFEYPFTSIKNEILKQQLSSVQKNNLRKKYNITGEKVIISVGRFIKSKGFDILLKSCENLPENYSVYIIGDKPTEEYLSLRKKLSLSNIYFIDFMSKEQLIDYYRSSDVFVLPTREDVWGLVVNEATSQGLPIITTDKCIAGLEMIKDNTNGYIVPVDDIETLNLRLMDVLQNNELQSEMSKNNIQLAKRYTIETMAKRHLEIFQLITKDNDEISINY